jgi:hypothetical protein
MKNMKKIFKGVAIAVALSTSSSVFADSGSKFSAFDGVPSESVSRVQLDEVSGKAITEKTLVKFSTAMLEKIMGKKLAKEIAQKYIGGIYIEGVAGVADIYQAGKGIKACLTGNSTGCMKPYQPTSLAAQGTQLVFNLVK